MADQPARMWSYYQRDNGTLSALEGYYSELLKSDAIIAAAYGQLCMVTLAIDARMAQLEEEQERI